MSLFDAGPKERRTGTTKALVVQDTDRCPLCLSPLQRESFVEDALLRHGGYGASRETTTAYCSRLLDRWCSWWMTVSVAEVRPPRAVA